MSRLTIDTARQLEREPAPAAPGRRRWIRFGRHYLEMVAAMVVGMVVLGAAGSLALAVLGVELSSQRHPELASLVMALNMSVAMAAWMRFRGHRWPGILEMVGAMFAAAVVLFPLLWVGAISGEALVAGMHVLMFPLMLAVMLRRRDSHW